MAAAMVTAVNCPHCNELNPSDALFCEVCGYDFTSGRVPTAMVTASPAISRPVGGPHTGFVAAMGWLVVVDVDQQ